MKSYSISKLQLLKLHTDVLRVSPNITFATANLINKNGLLLEKAVDMYKEGITLLRERYAASESATKEEEFQKEVRELNKKEFEVDVTELSADLFADVEGERAIPQQDGSILNIPYRESFFTLLGEIIKE